MEYQSVSLQQMKEALAAVAGSKFPVRITTTSADAEMRYVRGFADSQNNVVLVSETSYTLALKIVEVKDIAALEYAVEHTGGSARTFRAKWSPKAARI